TPPPDGTAAVSAVSLARSKSRRRGDRLWGNPGRNHSAPSSLLHAAREHRTTDHDRARHEQAPRPRAGTAARAANPPRRPETRADPTALGWARRRAGRRSDRTLGVWSYGLKVWVDMTASAHVLVFRPLIQLLRER